MQNLEERLAKLEKEVAQLKLASSKVNAIRKESNWISNIAGSFQDDPEFVEILRLGREQRKSEILGDE